MAKNGHFLVKILSLKANISKTIIDIPKTHKQYFCQYCWEDSVKIWVQSDENCTKRSFLFDGKLVLQKSAITRIREITVICLYKPKYSWYELTNTTILSMRRIHCIWFRHCEFKKIWSYCQKTQIVKKKPPFWKMAR